jgi:hypothetical protein
MLPLIYEGKRAKSVKAVLYAKGCELSTIVLDPLPSRPSRVSFECRKLPTVRLRGTVVGHSHPSDLTVCFGYTAHWDTRSSESSMDLSCRFR